ncbi:MAG: T9SS type A sorting domain-containing protein [Candidatus Latescibacterota bacterium]
MRCKLFLIGYVLLLWVGVFSSSAETSPDVYKMTEESGQNINPLLEVDSEGRIWMAWQRNQGNDRSIYTKVCDGNGWSSEMPAMDYEGKDSFDIVADQEGTVWIGWSAWDVYGGTSTVIVGASSCLNGEWHSLPADTIVFSLHEIYQVHVGSAEFFFRNSLRMVLSSSPPISYDLNGHALDKLTNAEWYEPWVQLCGLSQIGGERVWALFQIEWGAPTTGGWRGQFPTAHFLSDGRWAALEITEGGSSGGPGYTKYHRYVSAKSMGSDATNTVYMTCAVDDHPESQPDPNSSYEELITVLNLHLEVWSFDAATGDSLSHWDLGDSTGSGMPLSWKGDGIQVATTDESDVVGFAVSRSGNTSLRALQDPVWYKPVYLEEDSTVISQHPSAVVDRLGNIWVAWDDGTDIYLSSVRLSDMEVDDVLTSVESDAEVRAAAPTKFSLESNYPNPFNAATSIGLRIPFETTGTLTIYDVLGQQVRKLINGDLAVGEQHLVWDGRDEAGRDVSSGVYLCRLTLDEGPWTDTQKMALIR